MNIVSTLSNNIFPVTNNNIGLAQCVNPVMDKVYRIAGEFFRSIPAKLLLVAGITWSISRIFPNSFIVKKINDTFPNIIVAQSKVLIHISGFPGSGKTTLANKIKKKYPTWKVLGTDSFIDNKSAKIISDMIKQKKPFEEIKRFVNNRYQKAFKKHIFDSSHNLIIFEGHLSSCMPDGKPYLGQVFDHQFYLDPGEKTLILRYYRREVEQGILKDNKILEEVLKGNKWINGSKVTLEGYRLDKKDHKKRGYELMTEAEIESKIDKLVKEMGK